MTSDLIISLGGISIEPTDTSTPISAMDYTTSLIDDTPIVTLTPATLIDAEDATADLVGLTRKTTTQVGHAATQTLGFPAWAIINNPEHATLALSFLPDLQKADEFAATTSNKAKKQLVTIAAQLEEKAPHLLPTFYEQAARIFLKHSNTTYAAQMFTRAREAERTHSLDIDPERHQQVFTEFALAGAVTAKELSKEAHAAAERMSAQEALDYFTTLVTGQFRAGIAPYAGLAKDHRKLIEAANLDQYETEAPLVKAVVTSWAAPRLSPSLWKAWKPTVKRLVKDDASISEKLLQFIPHMGYNPFFYTGNPGDARDSLLKWITYMKGVGLTDALMNADAKVAARWVENALERYDTVIKTTEPYDIYTWRTYWTTHAASRRVNLDHAYRRPIARIASKSGCNSAFRRGKAGAYTDLVLCLGVSR